ncbi:hypothetical protein ES702_02642 [subsurface metagenome]
MLSQTSCPCTRSALLASVVAIIIKRRAAFEMGRNCSRSGYDSPILPQTQPRAALFFSLRLQQPLKAIQRTLQPALGLRQIPVRMPKDMRQAGPQR